MKIAVVGCGAVGSYYGALLCRAGHAVHFLLRSDYEAVRQHGVAIRSFRGDFAVQPLCAREPGEIGVCDLGLIGLKTTANDQFARLLPPLVGPRTAVLTLQNGLGNEEQLAQLFDARQILGGLCFVCLNRIEPGVIRHSDHGLVVIGEFQRKPQSRTQALAETFRAAGIECRVTDDLRRAHWEKLVWNVPFNGLGVAAAAGYEAMISSHATFRLPESRGPCLPTDALLGDPRWTALVRELMLEIIAAASAQGLVIPSAWADKNIERTRTMGAYKASTLLDFEQGRPLELDSLFLEPSRLAREAGVPTPRLERLCQVLTALDAD
jgi:2-dehydropantoate 2-reductase